MNVRITPAIAEKIRYLDRVHRFLSTAERALSDERMAIINKKAGQSRRLHLVKNEMNLLPSEHARLQRLYEDSTAGDLNLVREGSNKLPPRVVDREKIASNQFKELGLLEKSVADCDKGIAEVTERLDEISAHRQVAARFVERVRRELTISPNVDLSSISDIDMEKSRVVVS